MNPRPQGVPDDADVKTIKRAYYDLAMYCHPDKSGDDGHDLCIMLNEAYAILKDPISRRGSQFFDNHICNTFNFIAHKIGLTDPSPIRRKWLLRERESVHIPVRALAPPPNDDLSSRLLEVTRGAHLALLLNPPSVTYTIYYTMGMRKNKTKTRASFILTFVYIVVARTRTLSLESCTTPSSPFNERTTRMNSPAPRTASGPPRWRSRERRARCSWTSSRASAGVRGASRIRLTYAGF